MSNFQFFGIGFIAGEILTGIILSIFVHFKLKEYREIMVDKFSKITTKILMSQMLNGQVTGLSDILPNCGKPDCPIHGSKNKPKSADFNNVN